MKDLLKIEQTFQEANLRVDKFYQIHQRCYSFEFRFGSITIGLDYWIDEKIKCQLYVTDEKLVSIIRWPNGVRTTFAGPHQLISARADKHNINWIDWISYKEALKFLKTMNVLDK